METIDKKTCTKCGIEKQLSEFSRQLAGKYGKTAACKKCCNIRGQENYIKNVESITERHKKYRDRPENKKRSKERATFPENKRKKNEQSKLYNARPEVKKMVSKQKKEYRSRPEVRERDNIRNRTRKNCNPEIKLKCNLRSRFGSDLRNQSVKKTNKMFEYTGIKYNKYIEHLKQSEYWSDFCNTKNEIHIDHILPVASYDFTDTGEIAKCWNPRNLRLLPAKENLSKKDKIDWNLIYKHNIYDLLPKSILMEDCKICRI